jgi:FKBP-type peptidyl-prolyl cis-trans isomerase
MSEQVSITHSGNRVNRKGVLPQMRARLVPLAIVFCLFFSACEQESQTQQQQGAPESAPAQDAPAAGAPAPAGDPALTTDESKTIYAMGIELSKMIAPYNLTKDDLPAFLQGIEDGVLKSEPKVDMGQFGGPKFAELAKQRSAGVAAAQKKEAEPFLEKMAAEPGAQKKDSGLIYIEQSVGSGKQPTAEDTVKVHYTGTLMDGTVFDSSVERGTPASFPLKGVIPCWTEGLQLMKEGGKAKLICPADIAYGDAQKGPLIKPGSTLVFEVELLEVVGGGGE